MVKSANVSPPLRFDDARAFIWLGAIPIHYGILKYLTLACASCLEVIVIIYTSMPPKAHNAQFNPTSSLHLPDDVITIALHMAANFSK